MSVIVSLKDVTDYSFADVNGAHLRYTDQGQGPALVMIHSALADLTSWDAQLADFTPRYRVIRYDVRGWGESTGPEDGYHDYEDLAALLDHLGIQRAILMGCSYGGGIAIDFALACPERTAALIPVGPALSGHNHAADPLTDPINAAIHAAYDRGDKAEAAELTTHMWVDGPRRNSQALDPTFRQAAYAMILRTYNLPDRAPAQPLTPPAAERLSEIHTPTLLVLGEEDVPNMHIVTTLLAEGIPGARRVTLSGTAHLPNMERPREFNQAVLDFLAGLQ